MQYDLSQGLNEESVIVQYDSLNCLLGDPLLTGIFGAPVGHLIFPQGTLFL